MIEFSNGLRPLWHIALQKDGKILIGGDFSSVNGELRDEFARLDPDGNTDSDFSRDGEALQISEYFTVLQDDRILIGGGAILNSDGTLDPTFVSDFIWAEPMVIQPDGRILAAAWPPLTIQRFDANGSRDTNFHTYVEGPPLPYINVLALQPDGKVLIAGAFTNLNGVTRTNFARLIGQPANEVSVGAIRRQNEKIEFELKSMSPRNVTVEASTNFSDWLPVQTLSVSVDPVQFIDTNRMQFPNRIYRTSWQP